MGSEKALPIRSSGSLRRGIVLKWAPNALPALRCLKAEVEGVELDRLT
jgi:hypothetical protein